MDSIPRHRAVGYARVSTVEQSERGVSLETQRERITSYAAGRGLQLVELVVDPGVSAGQPLASRPGGQQLLGLIGAGEVDHVITLRLDRLFRDTVDCLTVTRAWDAAAVALHLIDFGGQSIDTSTAMGRHFLTMMSSGAELERNLLAERVRENLDSLARRGYYWTRHTPWGYQREERELEGRARAYYLPHPETGTLAGEMFDRAAAGDSAMAIAVWLLDLGNCDRQWHASHVSTMLVNPVYMGMRGGQRGQPLVAAVNVEPLISPQLWREVQVVRRAARRVNPMARRRDALPLSGLLVCGRCGARMWRMGGAPGMRYYRCSRAPLGECSGKFARYERLVEQLLPLVADHLSPAAVRARSSSRSAADSRRARRRLELEDRLDRLTEAYATAGMTLGEYQRYSAPVRAELASLSSNLEPDPLEHLPPLRTRADVDHLLAAMSRYDLRLLLQRLVIEVRVEDGMITEIRWA